MEDIKIITNKKNLDESKESPTSKSNKISYNCSECQSLIEIIKIDEEFIEFKCNNNHNIKMNIKEYLNTIKEYNDKNVLNTDITFNNSIYNKHEEEYLSYCFECNMHLCKKCLITGEHSYHYKINIIEIMPTNDMLLKLKKFIKDNKNKIKDLNKIKKKQKIK